MYLDTIPHEVAHIVTRFIHGSKVSAHGKEWKNIARRIGCTGNRCHTMELPRAKKRSAPRRRKARQLYISDGGTECLVGPINYKTMSTPASLSPRLVKNCTHTTILVQLDI